MPEARLEAARGAPRKLWEVPAGVLEIVHVEAHEELHVIVLAEVPVVVQEEVREGLKVRAASRPSTRHVTTCRLQDAHSAISSFGGA